jgi:hypothetical protein
MHPYIHERLAQARIDELIREAERHRLVQQVQAQARGRGADWPSRLALVIRSRRLRWQLGQVSEPAAGSTEAH